MPASEDHLGRGKNLRAFSVEWIVTADRQLPATIQKADDGRHVDPMARQLLPGRRASPHTALGIEQIVFDRWVDAHRAIKALLEGLNAEIAVLQIFQDQLGCKRAVEFLRDRVLIRFERKPEQEKKQSGEQTERQE